MGCELGFAVPAPRLCNLPVRVGLAVLGFPAQRTTGTLSFLDLRMGRALFVILVLLCDYEYVLVNVRTIYSVFKF